VVFLGVGTLGKKSDAYRASYWNETVKAVGAKRVIPIHWDDFWLPLTEPLQAMPLLIDDFGASMADLSRHAAQDGAELRLPPTFVPFSPFAAPAPSP
jgi:L-ascorbate metabolism protein UlaG (beta-lactamase superfamily)